MSTFVSPLAPLFDKNETNLKHIVERICHFLTDFQDRRSMGRVSKYVRMCVEHMYSMRGIRALTLGCKIQKCAPLRATDHQYFTNAPIYINDLAVADPQKNNTKLEKNMSQLVNFFENLFTKSAPFERIVLVFNKLKFPLINDATALNIFANSENAKHKQTFISILEKVKSAHNPFQGAFAAGDSTLTRLYDDRVFACFLVALQNVYDAERQITEHLFVRMESASASVRAFNARVLCLLDLLPMCKHLTLDYAPPQTDFVPPRLDNYVHLEALEIKVLQRRSLTDIALGEENTTRERIRLWLQESFKNMPNLKKFAIRVLPHMLMNSTFKHVMTNHWENMDDIMTLKDFFTNCPPSVVDLHFQSKATIRDIVTELHNSPKHMDVLKRLVVLAPADLTSAEELNKGVGAVMDLLTGTGARNLRQLVWITMRPIAAVDCTKIVTAFIEILKEHEQLSPMPAMLGMRFTNLNEVVKGLMDKKKITTNRMISQSHVTIAFPSKSGNRRLLHLHHAVADKCLKRRAVQSLAQLHGLRRPKYTNALHDQFSSDMF